MNVAEDAPALIPGLDRTGFVGRSTLRAAALTTIAYYLLAFVMALWTKAMLGDFSFLTVIAWAAPMMVVDGALAFSLFFTLRATRGFPRLPRWILLAAAVVLVSGAQSVWDTMLHYWSGKLYVYYNSPYEAFVRGMSVNVYQTGMMFALLALQAAYLEVREQKRDVIVARDRERRAQMLALRFQLNPHFMFNAMNALSSLIVVGRNREAEEMIERLSEFLRASLTSDPGRLVPLEEEFDLIDSYLDIERIRFRERLATAAELPAELRGALVPAFLLQPLVENAVKYAVAPSRATTTVRIAAERRGDELVLSVADDGAGAADGAAADGTGVGLANVRERLALEYQGAARMAVTGGPGGFAVEIWLPIAQAPDVAVERPLQAI